MIQFDKYFKEYKFKLTTVSPVAVRNGERLSPLVDYHIKKVEKEQEKEKYELYKIDEEKLFQEIGKSDEDLKAFESFIQERIGDKDKKEQEVKKNNLLKSFMEERNMRISDFYAKERESKGIEFYPPEMSEEPNWIQLFSTIKTNGKPYIPGSTIKGALKTAILYYWLDQTKEGQLALEKFKTILFNGEKKPSIIERVKNFEKDICKKVFGDEDTGKRLPSTNLKIADTQTTNKEDTFISQLGKDYNVDVNVSKEMEFKPSFQELIRKNISFDVDLSISTLALDWKGVKEDSYMYKILKDGDFSIIFKALKAFTSDYIKFELGRIKKSKTIKYLSYSEIKERLEILQPNETFICLGFGKSYLMNSVSLAIRKHDEESYEKVIKKLFVFSKKKKKSELSEEEEMLLFKNFPTSYYYDTSTNMPLGWCLLTDEQNKDKYYPSLEEEDAVDIKEIGGKTIIGILIKRGNPAKVKIKTITGEIEVNATGLSKYEKLNSKQLKIFDKCKVQIMAIKDGKIKDSKFV